MKVVGGWSQVLLLCIPHLRRPCFVTKSPGWRFNTHDGEEASGYLLVAKGWRPKQGQGIRGTVRSLWTEASQSLAASLPPGLAEVQVLVRPLGALPGRGGGWAAWVSCPPSTSLPTRELGRQRPFCLCKQSGLGVQSSLTQRSVLSAPGWQRGQACCWLRALWEPELGRSVGKLVNSSPAWLVFPGLSGPHHRPDSSKVL